jgi:signal transduction histidine kinase|tara:strand:+ start:1347 stop:3158 length:1812 start_codon:yes stop_codon:yes gene_type:complete
MQVTAQSIGVIEVDEQFKFQSIGKNVQFFDDSLDSYTAEEVFHLVRNKMEVWYTKGEDIPNFGNQNVPRWAYFSLSNHSGLGKELLLEINNSLINVLELYELNGEGEPELIGQSGDEVPFEKRTIKHRHNLFPIQLDAQAEKEFLLYIEKESVLNLPIVLWDRSEYHVYEQRLTILDGVYFGLLLLIVFYSIVLSIFLRELLYPIYGAYVFFLALVVFSTKGYGYLYLYSKYEWLSFLTTPDFGVLGAVFFILFSIQFLELRRHSFRFFKFLRAYLATYVIIYMLFHLWPNFIEENLVFIMNMYYSLTIILVFLGLASGFVVYRKNQSAAGFFIVSNVFMVGGVTIYAISEWGLLPLNFFTKNSIMIGSVIEMIILSSGIAYKIKQISDEKIELLRATTAHKQQLNVALVEGEKYERKRIADELHDSVGAHLSLLKNHVIRKLGNDDEFTEEIDMLSQEVREISHKLLPSTLSILGLKSSLMNLFEQFSQNSFSKVSIQDYDFPKELNNIDSHSVYRIVQEALNNIIKHSEAEEIIIQLFGYENEIQITIDDDGTGFDMRNAQKGLGLKSMLGRAESIGAKLTIDSLEGKGTSLMLIVSNNAV